MSSQSTRDQCSNEPPAASYVVDAEDLDKETALGVAAIRRAEITKGETSMTAATDLAVRRALEAAGVMFIDENGVAGPAVASALASLTRLKPTATILRLAKKKRKR